MKYISSNIICFSLLLSIIIFFLFPVTTEMSYCGETLEGRGYGFPFTYLIDDPTTSLYKIIDLKFFVIDIVIYSVLFIILITSTLLTVKKLLVFGKRTFIVLGIITFISILPFILILHFSSFSGIDYTPLYSTIKLNISFFNF